MRDSLRSAMVALKSFLRRVFAEGSMHAQRLRMAGSARRMVVFPSNSSWDAASNLRAWLLAPELRKLGWRIVVVPSCLGLSQRRRLLRLERPNFILLQQTRHALNKPGLYPGYQTILDADDADYLDPAHQARIGRCAEEASFVIGGSRFVADCMGKHNRNTHVIWTCTPLDERARGIPPCERRQIVAWAHSSPLDYQAESDFIRQVMTQVCAKTPCEFWLFGATEAAASEWFGPIRSAGGVCVAIPSMSYDNYLVKVAQAAVGLQPVLIENEFSRGKSFGKLLAYFSGRVAVVASNAVDHPLFFRHRHNGCIVDNDVQAWVDEIIELLCNKNLRSSVAEHAWASFKSRLTSGVHAKLLNDILLAPKR